jgi:hypothetical protein
MKNVNFPPSYRRKPGSRFPRFHAQHGNEII